MTDQQYWFFLYRTGPHNRHTNSDSVTAEQYFMWQSYLNGALIALGLIMAIGAQNAFVLAQGLRREHHLPVALVCIACDALLVAAGVFGLASLLAQSPVLLAVARWGGVVFLLWYGSQALRRACSRQSLQHSQANGQRSRRAVLLSALAVTLLNPHVYIDVCSGRCERFIRVVHLARTWRSMAGALARPACHLAPAGSDGGGDDVYCCSATDPLSLTARINVFQGCAALLQRFRTAAGTSIPHSCCVVKDKARCYDPAPAPQRVKTHRRMFCLAARDRPCD
jgi:hypothetical protein